MAINPSAAEQTSAGASSDFAQQVLRRYLEVRGWSERLCEPLAPEDCVIQSMPDVSPMRWHLAHTTWFFETFVLGEAVSGYRRFNEAYAYLFNSYYNGVGRQFPRPQRGLLSRPTMAEIGEYRQAVDEQIVAWLYQPDANRDRRLLEIIELGLQHEQQHQELMLTDIKHVFSCNPLYPTYTKGETFPAEPSEPRRLEWHEFGEGVFYFGHEGNGFAYDNEMPRHRAFVPDFRLSSRLVTNEEYLEFIEDGGYRRPDLWLSLGWNQVQAEDWTAPMYWVERDGQWHQFTLHGLQPLRLDEPVCHVSYFEADAFARWHGSRLPTEQQWELVADGVTIQGNFRESKAYHPQAAPTADLDVPAQLYGDLWEWTSSSYSPYPGYQPPDGALGEYNGKFMCNQYVMRGGSCATPRSHIRHTYRNFFPPETRWQFTGIRLAR